MYYIPIVSIIIPCYNEAENIRLLTKEITNVMKNHPYKYEIVFVNDGSTDNSWNIIQELINIFPTIQGVDLAGNYGQTLAFRAGLHASQGDVIVAMDGDMQHDPSYIPLFLSYIEQGYDMVSGAKEQRPDGLFASFLATIAHKTICAISGVKLNYFGATFKVYRRYMLENVNLIGDAHRFLGALVVKKGTKFIELPINIRQRNAGVSKYKLSKAFLVVVDLLFLKFAVSYMNKPFRLFGIPGLILFLIGTGMLSYYSFGALVFKWFIGKEYQMEFICAIFITLFAIVLLSLGIIAQIGVFNSYSDPQHEPFAIREHTKNVAYYG